MRHHFGKKTGSLGSAVGLVLASMANHAQATNLLVNPGFESPSDPSTNNDSMATGWTLYGDTLRATFKNHTAGGQWSVWNQTYAGPGGIFQAYTGPVTIGATYSLTADWLFETGYTATTAVEDMALIWENGGGGVVGTPVSLNIGPGGVTADGTTWTPFTISGVAPAGATQIVAEFDTDLSGAAVVNNGGPQSAFVDDADLEGPGVPPTIATWALNSSGDWNVSGNWSTGSIPNSVGVEADFAAVITSAQTVYSNIPVTVGTVHFNNPNTYVIAGAGSLTIQATTGNSGLIKVDQGTDILQIPVIIASNTTLNVASGAKLIVSNTVAVNPGDTLTQTGAGTVTYNSIITVGTTGAIAFGNSTHAHQLSLASGSTASVTGTGTVLQLDSLSNGGTLDLQKNAMIISYGSGADPIATIKAELTAGYAGGAWNGAGINSSIAHANSGSFGLGYADSADPGNPAGLASGTIEVVYTLLGDANLDGAVNGSDFAILATNFNKAVSGWDQGDFNYDGSANGADFAFIASNFNKGTTIAVADVAALDSFAAANGLLTNVPEPTCTALAAVAALGILRRRRRTKSTNSMAI